VFQGCAGTLSRWNAAENNDRIAIRVERLGDRPKNRFILIRIMLYGPAVH
jgi:hypothetical protein